MAQFKTEQEETKKWIKKIKEKESIVTRESCEFVKGFIEEVIYKLIERLSLTRDLDDLSAVIISNPKKEVVFSHQSTDFTSHKCGVWDYGVILLEKRVNQFVVYDFYTSLPFPCSARNYFEKTFGYKSENRYFRHMKANIYLKKLSSDRSSMKVNGQFITPPPIWPSIWKGEDTLQKMIIMIPDELGDCSKIYTESGFENEFCKNI